jgi:hypothetical protein
MPTDARTSQVLGEVLVQQDVDRRRVTSQVIGEALIQQDVDRRRVVSQVLGEALINIHMSLGGVARKTSKDVAAIRSGTISANPVRTIVCGRQVMPFGRKCLTDGSPLTPCLEFDYGGFFRFRWPMGAGLHELSMDVRNLSGLLPYPVITLRANPAIGINADVVGSAVAGTGWQTIGPLSVTATGNGAIWVELFCAPTGNNPKTVRWDNLVIA